MADAHKRAMVQVGTGATVIYTAPSTNSTFGVLRTIHICNESAQALTYTIGIQTGASTPTDGSGKRIFASVPIAGNSSTQWTGNLPLNGAATNPDILYGLASQASSITVSVGLIEVT